MSSAPSIESIQQAALQLQPAARAQLTHTLIQSLSSLPEAEIAALWVAESERREAELESGQVRGVDSDEVLRRIQNRYGK